MAVTRAAPAATGAHDPAGLLAGHEAIARELAAQGDWRRAYEHLGSALELARAGAS
ncbi:GGDEF domain-containing protein, partial [Prauserella sp. ASG 168]|nr:GGDEF domain-containing protein [Prauserella cavernicola]